MILITDDSRPAIIMAYIHIDDKDKDRLDKICREANLSQAEVFHKAIAALEKQHLAKRLKLDFEALALDSAAIEEYKAESTMFDQASSDGLKECT